MRRSIVGSTRASSSSRSTVAALVGLDALDPHPGAQPLDQLLGRGDADVGGDQGVLDLLPGVLVEAVPGQQREQGPAQAPCERARRWRRRTSRPAVPSGRSRVVTGAAGSSGAAGGASSVIVPPGAAGGTSRAGGCLRPLTRATRPTTRPHDQDRRDDDDEDGDAAHARSNQNAGSRRRQRCASTALRRRDCGCVGLGDVDARQCGVHAATAWTSAEGHARHEGVLARGRDQATSSKIDTLAMAAAFHPLRCRTCGPRELPRNDFVLRRSDGCRPDLRAQERRLRDEVGRTPPGDVPADVQERSRPSRTTPSPTTTRPGCATGRSATGTPSSACASTWPTRHTPTHGCCARWTPIDLSSRRYPDLEVLYRVADGLVTDYSAAWSTSC